LADFFADFSPDFFADFSSHFFPAFFGRLSTAFFFAQGLTSQPLDWRVSAPDVMHSS
jgi:hypothetical protein